MKNSIRSKKSSEWGFFLFRAKTVESIAAKIWVKHL